jgi:hypothetical protein
LIALLIRRNWRAYHLGRKLDGIAGHLDESNVEVLVEDSITGMDDELLHVVITLFISCNYGG